MVGPINSFNPESTVVKCNVKSDNYFVIGPPIKPYTIIVVLYSRTTRYAGRHDGKRIDATLLRAGE